MELKDAVVSPTDAIKNKKFVLELRTPAARKPAFFLVAPSQELMQDWLAAIQQTINEMNPAPPPAARVDPEQERLFALCREVGQSTIEVFFAVKNASAATNIDDLITRESVAVSNNVRSLCAGRN